MSDPFIGEIRWFPYNFMPVGYLLCDGSLQRVVEYQVLFTVIGNTYGNGSSGRDYFALPNLLGKGAVAPDLNAVSGVPYCAQGHSIGSNTISLTTAHLPSHSHGTKRIKTAGGYGDQTAAPSGTSYLGGLSDAGTSYPALSKTTFPDTALADGAVSIYGNSVAHENRQPFLVMRPGIAYDGIYPVPD